MCPPQVLSGMVSDPRDCRRLCLTGPRGTLSVVDLTDPIGKDDVQIRQYKLTTTAGAEAAPRGGTSGSTGPAPSPPLYVSFSVTRDLLFVLLPREVVVLDLELGVPASNQV